MYTLIFYIPHKGSFPEFLSSRWFCLSTYLTVATCQSFTETIFFLGSTCKNARIQNNFYRSRLKEAKEKKKNNFHMKQILNDTSLTVYLLHTKGFLLTMEFYMKSNLMHTVENLIFKVKDAAENLRQCI